KGFATMLIVSILVSFLTAVFGTRLLLGLWVNSEVLNKRFSLFGVKEKDIQDIADTSIKEATFGGRKLSILSQQRKIFTFSSDVLIIGIISLFVFKLNPGIDFTSGSRIEVLADQAISVEEIEEKLEQLDLEPQSVLLSGEDNEIAITRYDTILTKEEIAEISDFFVEEYGHEPSVSVVSPIVGEKLVKDAIYALAIAAVGMIIYVTFRFEFYFGITAILTLLHDVFFMLVILSITRIEFDVTIVAAILTIVGYSIN